METAKILQRVHVDAGGCWLWTGSVDRKGYGLVFEGRKHLRAHRVFFEHFRGATNSPLDHLCRNRLCVNPDHLDPVPQPENVRRGMSFSGVNFRKSTCCHGHPFDAANTGKVAGQQRRVCKTCDRLRHREAAKRAKVRRTSTPQTTAGAA